MLYPFELRARIAYPTDFTTSPALAAPIAREHEPERGQYGSRNGVAQNVAQLMPIQNKDPRFTAFGGLLSA